MSRRLTPFASLAVAGLLAAACSSPIRNYRCAEVQAADAAVEPGAVWRCNVEVMQRIVKAKPFSLREFWEAAEFLENLTGIPADARQTPQGRVPGPEIAKSLRSWQDWYAAHAAELEWDAASGTVRLAAPDEG